MFINIILKNGEMLCGEYKQNAKSLTFGAYSVDGFYNRPSRAKRDAEEKILNKMTKCGGHGYYVTGGNTCTFSAVWFIEIDGESFQVRETASSRYIEGPKTITIQNAIDAEKRARRILKKERKEKEMQIQIDKQNTKAYILNIYDELKDVLEDEYKTLYNILDKDAREYINEETKQLKNAYYFDWLKDILKDLVL